MQRLVRLLASALLLVPAACRTAPNYDQPLPPGARALLPVPPDEVPDLAAQWEERDAILPALDQSIRWTRRTHAQRFFPVEGITHARALASLERFRDALVSATGPDDFQRRVVEGFDVYRSAGWDGRGGGVLFTAYCTPVLEGSLERSAAYRYPLYATPADLEKGRDGEILGWRTAAGTLPFPTRRTIEAKGLLEGRGLELVWLRDPIDAFLAHVNGSAFVRLRDGSTLKLGYAAKNGRDYTSLGRELEEDGKLPRGTASLRRIRAWAAEAPEEEVREYLHRNAAYVFFQPIDGTPHGSLDVPVTPERSIATDKTLFPRGAVCFVEAEVPPTSAAEPAPFRKVVLDQDTGGAIRTAGRADLYLGVGPEAEDRAGRTKSEGRLYYLFAKEPAVSG